MICKDLLIQFLSLFEVNEPLDKAQDPSIQLIQVLSLLETNEPFEKVQDSSIQQTHKLVRLMLLVGTERRMFGDERMLAAELQGQHVHE